MLSKTKTNLKMLALQKKSTSISISIYDIFFPLKHETVSIFFLIIYLKYNIILTFRQKHCISVSHNKSSILFHDIQISFKNTRDQFKAQCESNIKHVYMLVEYLQVQIYPIVIKKKRDRRRQFTKQPLYDEARVVF